MAGTMAGGGVVAKKVGNPGKPEGEGRPVRLHPELVNKARIIAMRRGARIGEYMSSLLEGPINRDYQKVLKELAEEEGRK